MFSDRILLGRNIAWLREINAKDQNAVGWKAVVLADLFNEAFPLPMAFVITTQCYVDCLKENRILDWIQSDEKELNWDNESEVSAFSQELREKIESMEFNELLKKELKQSYLKLGERSLGSLSTAEETQVAIRGSPTENDRMMESELNVQHFPEVLDNIKKCWSSQYTISAMMEHKRNFLQWHSAVIVQKMARPDVSGTLYSSNPWNESKEIIALQAVLGLQAPLMEEFPQSGDFYSVEKKSLKVLEKKTQKQSVYYSSARFRETVPLRLQEKSKLSDNQVTLLCKMAKQLELHYKMPVEMDWAIENSRPMVLGLKAFEAKPKPAEEKTPHSIEEKIVSLKPAQVAMDAEEFFSAELHSLVKEFATEKNLETKQAMEELIKMGLEKHQQVKAGQQAIPMEDKTTEIMEEKIEENPLLDSTENPDLGA